MTLKRVVITGLGGISAIGSSAGEIWQGMKTGRDGCGPIPSKGPDLKITTGFPIPDSGEDDGIDPRQRVTMGEFSRLAVLAARDALGNSGLSAGSFDSARAGAIVGAGVYGADAVDQSFFDILVHGKKRAHIFAVPRAMPGAPAGQVSMAFGLRGPVFGVTSACSSANHAIATAVDQIRLGRADVMVAGGTDAPLSYSVLKGWESMRVMARSHCRPFSKNRDGLMLGDGAGMAVLESHEHALARGAPVLAEILGIGLSGDASDIVNPTIEGPTSAMVRCLQDAGISPADVHYINAHGTGTQANDRTETQAIRRAFGAAADLLSVSSTKSMHGHCLGASAALEMIACVNAIREGIVPPTINYEEADPDCDLDVTPNTARRRTVDIALSNSFAFGGTNAVIAFARV